MRTSSFVSGSTLILCGLISVGFAGCNSNASPDGGEGDSDGGADSGDDGPGDCAVGELDCSGVCAKPETDSLHCGACDNACESGQVCSSGACTVLEPPATTCEAPIALEDTSTPDRVVGDGTAASCTQAALEEAVAQGGVITFDCGDAATIDVTAALQLRTDVDTIIDGEGKIVLDGGRGSRQTRIFEFNSPDYRVTTTRVVLQRLTLQNAEAPASDFTPQNPDNEACAWGYKDGEGGAVRVRDGRLHVIDCVFQNNKAASPGPDTGGGAIYALGALEVIVVGSSFIGNEGSNSGAVGLLQTDGIFYNSVFEGNSATGNGQNYGGAAGCPDFNHPLQGGSGGNAAAVGIDGGSVERIDFCGVVFRDNVANELATVGRTPNEKRGVSTFNFCLFEGNQTGDGGGAIWMQDMDFRMYNTTLTDNSSDGLGGAVRIDQGPHGSTLLIENSTFHRNVANRSLGGGLVFAGNGSVRNCTFAENEAAGGEGFFGAAIVAMGEGFGGLTIDNTVFWNNTTGHEWTPMTCSIDNPGAPGVLPGSNNAQWPTLHTNSEQPDQPCTADISFEDAQLGALADNGGPTPTMMPAAGSVVVGLGQNCPETDQRGEPRPASGCTAGAVEVD